MTYLLEKSPFDKEWRSRFERFARNAATDHQVSGWSENGLSQRLTLFEKLLRAQNVSAPGRILDLGCGAGTYVRFLTGLGHWVVGLDYSLPSLSRATAADSRRAGQYLAGEAYALPFENGQFDLVVSLGVLQAIAHPERALDEMTRVLRPTGLLVIEFLNAFEFIAFSKGLKGRITRRHPHIRTYSPFLVHRWFLERGFQSVRRTGVYLPPHRFSCLGRVFDKQGIARIIEGIPGLSLAVAHAFLVVGKKV